MDQRRLVRIGACTLLLVGALLTVQAVAQRQTAQNRSPAPEEGVAAPAVRFRGHLQSESLKARLESLRGALAGIPAGEQPEAPRVVQESGGERKLELRPERANVVVVRPTEDGTWQVICEDSPAEAQEALGRFVERQR